MVGEARASTARGIVDDLRLPSLYTVDDRRLSLGLLSNPFGKDNVSAKTVWPSVGDSRHSVHHSTPLRPSLTADRTRHPGISARNHQVSRNLLVKDVYMLMIETTLTKKQTTPSFRPNRIQLLSGPLGLLGSLDGGVVLLLLGGVLGEFGLVLGNVLLLCLGLPLLERSEVSSPLESLGSNESLDGRGLGVGLSGFSGDLSTDAIRHISQLEWIQGDIPDNVGSLLSLVQVEELPDLGSSVNVSRVQEYEMVIASSPPPPSRLTAWDPIGWG